MVYLIGDIVTTKKNHPCGGNEWTIVRVGADVKIKCNKCGRVVMLDLEDFKKRVIKVVRGSNDGQ